MVLDDFGTGYSSASYLTQFPFDKIKIDKSITQGAAQNRACAAIVASALALARGLEIATTAEGIETEEQFELLQAAGANLVQGFLFGRPVPLHRFGENTPALHTQDVAIGRPFIESHKINFPQSGAVGTCTRTRI
jgi:EAL domain-containing protein (putative c-di-GMP-specific phosphodiesterase class I)